MMEEQIRTILAETLGVPATEITPEKRLIDDLGLTSFDLADVVLQAQEEFGITLPSSLWGEIVTVADVYRAVKEAVQP